MKFLSNSNTCEILVTRISFPIDSESFRSPPYMHWAVLVRTKWGNGGFLLPNSNGSHQARYSPWESRSKSTPGGSSSTGRRERVRAPKFRSARPYLLGEVEGLAFLVRWLAAVRAAAKIIRWAFSPPVSPRVRPAERAATRACAKLAGCIDTGDSLEKNRED